MFLTSLEQKSDNIVKLCRGAARGNYTNFREASGGKNGNEDTNSSFATTSNRKRTGDTGGPFLVHIYGG
jgi:hypothetical protein